MMLHVPQVLNPAQVGDFRERLAKAKWVDGRITAGHQSVHAKNNQQLLESDPDTIELAKIVHAALMTNALFFSAALPCRIFPILFNRYAGGGHFGAHIDNAVRYDRSEQVSGRPPLAVRIDLSATLFLSAPDEYEGGELVVQDTFGEQKVKLPAGDLVLYPASSVHRVEPVTRGERLASFLWVQSMVRDDGERTLLFQLDNAIQKLNREHSSHPAMIELTGVYHNLLRKWTEA